MNKHGKSCPCEQKREKLKISLIDKCLLVILAIIFIQTAFNLFECGTEFSDKNAVDVIIRTSSGAIFGYFISANFMPAKSNRDSKSKIDSLTLIQNEIYVENNIDLNQTGDKQGYLCNRYQVIIITIICITSLLILIIGRNLLEFTSQSAPIVSQLKDFVSASIGFLISCGKNHKT